MKYALAFALILMGCQAQQKAPQEDISLPTIEVRVPVEVPPASDRVRIHLYWEDSTEPHPERIPWTDRMMGHVEKNFDLFDNAKDIRRICPRYNHLNYTERLKAIGEFLAWLSYYESAWRPATAVVDVGKPDKPDTWSVGLFQVSVVDQSWAGGGYSYTFEQLKSPLPNIDLAMALMVRQLRRNGLFILPNSHKDRYWAIILEGNKYQKIDEILGRVKKHAPFCYLI